jgi:hypothetical protein
MTCNLPAPARIECNVFMLSTVLFSVETATQNNATQKLLKTMTCSMSIVCGTCWDHSMELSFPATRGLCVDLHGYLLVLTIR